jgi:hypothetical protein
LALLLLAAAVLPALSVARTAWPELKLLAAPPRSHS